MGTSPQRIDGNMGWLPSGLGQLNPFYLKEYA